jgi:mono/diheme cytochrome c family protein
VFFACASAGTWERIRAARIAEEEPMRSVALILSPIFAFSLVGSAAAQDAAKGKQVYEAAMPKCKTCHSVAGVGNPKGSLDDAGAKLKAEEIKAWLRTPKEMTEKAKATRKPAMPAYPKEKLSDADLDSLTAYLLSLKK